MHMIDLIAKKRDGQALTKEEIAFIIQGYTAGDIPDYQMSALAMAIYFQGMTDEETAELTLAMAASGEQLDLSAIAGTKVDKHSTGGVGDKTTLVVAPLVAAAGLPVAKMSGRGLGFTGGTVDKLEAIRGYQVERTRDQFYHQVQEIGIALIGQTGNLTPADKKLYALRDVTATVDSIPLIASSIMSKKIAAGADAILLDVKVGSGAFMKTLADAERLSQAMVRIGQQVGRNTMAVISDMNQPLGLAVGNALEVTEAIETLKGRGPADLTQLSLALGAHMLLLAGKSTSYEQASELLSRLLTNGQALEKLKQLISAQGGDQRVVDDPALLPAARYQIPVVAEQSGYVTRIDAAQIGHAALLLGAGRVTKESSLDLAVGIKLNRKVSQQVSAGDLLATVHANDEQKAEQAIHEIKAAFQLGEHPVAPPKLIYKTVKVV